MSIYILAEGDSWFVSGKDIVRNLEKVKNQNGDKRFKVKKLAREGDEAIDMMSGSSKHKLAKLLEKNKYDALLFSGGIRDILRKEDFSLFIKPYKDTENIVDLVNTKTLDRRLDMICRAYSDLVDFTIEYPSDETNKIKVITHTYDLSQEDTSEEIWCGDYKNTWLYDIFTQKKGFPENNFTIQKEIVHLFITKLRKALLDLALLIDNGDKRGLFFVADTHNILQQGDWAEELLPNNKGLKKLTEKIITDGIDKAFP